MIQAIIPYKEYATITHRTLFIYILARKTKNIYSEWCQSVRQLRTDGDPAPFLTLKNAMYINSGVILRDNYARMEIRDHFRN